MDEKQIAAIRAQLSAADQIIGELYRRLRTIEEAYKAITIERDALKKEKEVT